MRSYLAFLAVIAGTLLVAALLSYPLFLVVHAAAPTLRFDKVATRLWQLLMLLALVVVVRRQQLTSRDAFGYGLPRIRWRRQFVFGLGLGVLTMLPVAGSMLALGVRTLRAEAGPAAVAHAVLVGLLSGLAVGLVEETFFRGLMQGAVARESRRPWLAIAAVAPVYASVHFLAGMHIPAESVHLSSGLDLLGGALRHFAAPGTILDAWLALLAVGLALGLAAWWTGAIALGAGLHAGWVCVMRATVGITDAAPGARWGWLANPDNGFVGWLVLTWTLLLLALAFVARRRLRRLRRHP